LIPRIQNNGRVTDLNTNRCRYSNPYILGDWVGYTNQLAKKIVASLGPKTTENKILAKIGELNLEQKTSAFSKFGCKNAGFVEAIVVRGAELHRDTFELFENKAVFADGSEFECDVIVGCTGYRNNFPFFEEHHPELAEAARNPRLQYKQIFNPCYGSEIAFFGFARPAFGSIPPTTEMQSRFYSMVINGELTLPSKEEMQEIAAKDQANWDYRFGYDAKRVRGLVDFQLYCDDLAKIIGCFPPLRELFIRRPKIWWKIMFGPFTMHQYRLVGPYANVPRAEEVYERQPVGDLLESSITATFLVTAKTLSMVGFKQFTPNSF
jgi:dimethylaniline monooxygenase (N-oxide forming)